MFALRNSDDALTSNPPKATSTIPTDYVVAPAAATNPDLAISTLSVGASVVAGGTQPISFSIVNSGTASAAPTTTRLYLSQDAFIDASDTLIGTFSTAALGAGAVSGIVNTSTTIPGGLPPGTYNIIVNADATNAVTNELSETNNVFARSFTVTSPGPASTQYGLDFRQAGAITATRIANDPTDNYRFVANYLGPASQGYLTKELASSYAGAGLAIVSIYEATYSVDDTTKYDPNHDRAGYIAKVIVHDNGVKHATRAASYAAAIGQPAGSAIYFAVDADVLRTELPNVLAYFQGIQDGLMAASGGVAKYQVGVYGSGFVIDEVFKLGLASFKWLAFPSWLGSSGYTAFDLRQTSNDRLDTDLSASVRIDRDIASDATFGQWGAVEASALPDLEARKADGRGFQASLHQSTVTQGAIATIGYAVTNLGLGTAPPSISGVFRSTNGSISLVDPRVAEDSVDQLAPGSTTVRAVSFSTADWMPGQYYLAVVADYGKQLPETDDSNNQSNVVLLTVLPHEERANRAPTVVTHATTLVAGQEVQMFSLFSANDPDGDRLTFVEFFDPLGTGTFVLHAGATTARWDQLTRTLLVAAGEAASVAYVGSSAGAEVVKVRASDGALWSPWMEAPISVIERSDGSSVNTGVLHFHNITWKASSDGSFAGSGSFSLGALDIDGSASIDTNGYAKIQGIISTMVGATKLRISIGPINVDTSTGKGSIPDSPFELGGVGFKPILVEFAGERAKVTVTVVLPSQLGNLALGLDGALVLVVSPDDARLESSFGFVAKVPDISLNLFDKLGIRTKDVSLDYDILDNELTLKGSLVLKPTAPLPAIEIDLGDQGIVIKDGKLSSLDLSFALGDFGFKGLGFSQTSAHLVLGSLNDSFSAHTKLSLPIASGSVSVEAGLTVRLNPLELQAIVIGYTPPTPIPVGSTGIFITALSGGLNHLASSDQAPVLFSGSVDLSFGQGLATIAKLNLGGEIDVNHASGHASGYVISRDVLAITSVDALLDWRHERFSLVGSIDILKGTVLTNARLNSDFHLNLTSNGTAAINIPGTNFSGIGSYELVFSNDDDLSNDYAKVWTTVSRFGISTTVGATIYFDKPLLPSPFGEVTLFKSWIVDETMSDLLVRAEWTKPVSDAGPTRVVIYDDLQKSVVRMIVEENEYEAHGIAVIGELGGSTSKVVWITGVSPGVYDLEFVSDAALGTITMSASTTHQQSIVHVEASIENDANLQISYQILDPDGATHDNRTVTFFADTNSLGLDGVPIGSTLGHLTSGTVNEPILGLHEGQYWIYARLSEAGAASTFAYAASSIIVPNVAPNAASISVNATEDTVLVGTLPTAIDANGDLIAYAAMGLPEHGAVVVGVDGNFKYTPSPNFGGRDSFSFAVSDGKLTRNFDVTVLVATVNDAPTVAKPLLDAETATGAFISLGIDAETFSDIDGDRLTLSSLLADGSALPDWLKFEPAIGRYSGTPIALDAGVLHIVLRASDGQYSAVEAFTLVVRLATNSAPVAANGNLAMEEDLAVAGLLPRAVDVEGDLIVYRKITDPAHGLVAIGADGSFYYVPANNFSGNDSFSYLASDGSLSSAPATFSLVVAPINDPPTASNGSASGNANTLIVGTLSATDVDSSLLVYTIVTQPTKGTVSVGANGAFTFIPAAFASGSDSFIFKASDGVLYSNVATVTLTILPVNDTPGTLTVTDISIREGNDGTKTATVTVTRSGGSAACSVKYATADGTASAASGDYSATAGTLNFAADQTTQSITVAINGDTAVEPDETFFVNLSDATNGATISDNQGLGTILNDDSLASTPEVGVSGNAANILDGDITPTTFDFTDFGPIAQGDAPLTRVFTVINTGSAELLTSNLTVPIGFSLVEGLSASISAGSSDTFTVQLDSTVVGTKNGGQITFTTNDSDENPFNFSITGLVTTGNHPPTSSSLSIIGFEDAQLNGALPQGQDIDGDAFTFAKAVDPGHGTAVINAVGNYAYTPAANYNGQDSFGFSISDGHGGTNIYTVSVTVQPVVDVFTGTADNDFLVGLADADLMFGLDGNDYLVGAGGNDSLNGGGGIDTLDGGTGNDVIDGGAGLDTAVYSVVRSNASVQRSGAAWVIASPATGSDTLTGVERIRFTDASLALDLDGNAGITAKIIGAVFGKQLLQSKDYVGIGLSLLDSGMSYADLVAAALGTDLFKQSAGATNGVVTNTQFVKLVYRNVVGVLPSQSELDLYVGKLDRHDYTQQSLAVLACETAANLINIDLVGLSLTGIAFTPPLGG